MGTQSNLINTTEVGQLNECVRTIFLATFNVITFLQLEHTHFLVWVCLAHFSTVTTG